MRSTRFPRLFLYNLVSQHTEKHWPIAVTNAEWLSFGSWLLIERSFEIKGQRSAKGTSCTSQIRHHSIFSPHWIQIAMYIKSRRSTHTAPTLSMLTTLKISHWFSDTNVWKERETQHCQFHETPQCSSPGINTKYGERNEIVTKATYSHADLHQTVVNLPPGYSYNLTVRCCLHWLSI